MVRVLGTGVAPHDLRETARLAENFFGAFEDCWIMRLDMHHTQAGWWDIHILGVAFASLILNEKHTEWGILHTICLSVCGGTLCQNYCIQLV